MCSTFGLCMYFAFFWICVVSSTSLYRDEIEKERRHENDLRSLVNYLDKRVEHQSTHDQLLGTAKRSWGRKNGWRKKWPVVKNYCEDDPCENGACKNSWVGYVCYCKPGWIGRHCNEAIDVCYYHTCVHGKCLQFWKNYTCICDAGWKGRHCETNVNEIPTTIEPVTEIVTESGQEKRCNVTSCVHGVCKDNVCICDSGWKHDTCDQLKTDCEDDPCENGDCKMHVLGYMCFCKPGWGGRHCNKANDVCDYRTCVHGKCFQFFKTYTCVCDIGWAGKNCDSNVNEIPTTIEPVTEIVTESGPEKRCNVTSCVHGVCEDNVCICDSGWTHDTCDQYASCSNASVSGQFYFAHSDKHCFIQCDEFGKTYEHCCPAKLVWSQKDLACRVVFDEDGSESGESEEQTDDIDKEIDNIKEMIDQIEEELDIYETVNGGPDKKTDEIEKIIDEITEDIDDHLGQTDQEQELPETTDEGVVIDHEMETQSQELSVDDIDDMIDDILQETTGGNEGNTEEEYGGTSLEELEYAEGNNTNDIVDEQIEEIDTEINMIEDELKKAIEDILKEDNSTESDTDVDVPGNESDVMEEIEEAIDEIEDENESEEIEDGGVEEPMTTPLSGLSSRCPAESKASGKLRIFAGRCYQFIEEELTWYDAEEKCRGMGGSLVQIQNKHVQNFLYKNLTEDLKWPFNGVWLGATDEDMEGEWLWITGEKLTWTNWANGNPSWLSGDCANLRLDKGGKWEDKFCNSFFYKYSYICQYDMMTPTPETTTALQTEILTTETVPTTAPTPEAEATTNMPTEQVITGNDSPCTEDAIKEGRFFHPYPGYPAKYIRCDEWGMTFVHDCPNGTVWVQSETTCGRTKILEKRPSTAETRRRLLLLKRLLSKMDKK